MREAPNADSTSFSAACKLSGVVAVPKNIDLRKPNILARGKRRSSFADCLLFGVIASAESERYRIDCDTAYFKHKLG